MTEEEALEFIKPWVRRMLVKIRIKKDLVNKYGTSSEFLKRFNSNYEKTVLG